MYYIIIQGIKYYFYGNYNTYQLAHKQARYFRKRNKSRYYIIKKEGIYKLYMNKTMKMW